MLKGTPQGDATFMFVLENKNDSISRVLLDTTGTETCKITNVEFKESEIKLHFTAQGYDVNLLLNKKDDEHVSEKLLNMFDGEGDTVKAK